MSKEESTGYLNCAIAFSSTYYKATLIKTHGIGEMINIRISGPELIQYNF